MPTEYYLEYYDPKGRRGFTKYYLTKQEAEDKKDRLENQGFQDVKIITFRY